MAKWWDSPIGSEYEAEALSRFQNGEDWGYDFREPQPPYTWEPTESGLTFKIGPGSVSDMAKTDVVEYTHHTKRESESIKDVYWNQNTNRLTVAFVNGGVYSYDEVGKGLYNDFVRAESMGRYFREMFRMSEWPGAKHDDRLVRFVVVPVEGPDWETDLDSLKVTRLTNSAYKGNQQYTIHFTYTGKEEVDVRAADTDEAVQLVRDYFADKNVTVTIDGIFIHM